MKSTMKKLDANALMKQCRDEFDAACEWEEENREDAVEDLEFSRASRQWPYDIERQRLKENRPCLTINKMPSFIRQVVNDARQNKPAIKVHPIDSSADKETAEVIEGLVRNIEMQSKADVAYDTAVEQSVSGGFGYFRVNVDYAYEDSFDQDIKIDRIVNQFSVYGDPNSTSADSSDWNTAFIVDRYTEDEFEAEWGDKAKVDFDDKRWSDEAENWRDDDTILVAEWWKRYIVDGTLYQLSDGTVVDDQTIQDEDIQIAIEAGIVAVTQERPIKRYQVIQRFVTGLEVLEEVEWVGKYIPIIPVYGDEFWI